MTQGDSSRSTASQLDTLLREALHEFATDIFGRRWLGKEHDCVNRFVLRHLSARVTPGAPLSDLAQVRIEGGVPAPSGVGSRPSARKDVVIWPDPDATCWSDGNGDGRWIPLHTPLAVMEWKADLRGRHRPRLSDYDLAWLAAAAQHWPGFVGYAVLMHRDVLIAARCQGATIEPDWLRLRRSV